MCVRCLKDGLYFEDDNKKKKRSSNSNNNNKISLSSPPSSLSSFSYCQFITTNQTTTIKKTKKRPRWSPIKNNEWWNETLFISSFQSNGIEIRYCNAIPRNYSHHVIILPEWNHSFLEYSDLIKLLYDNNIAVWSFDQQAQGIYFFFWLYSFQFVF